MRNKNQRSDGRFVSKMFYRVLPVQIFMLMLTGINNIVDGMIARSLSIRRMIRPKASASACYGAGKDLDETFGLIETAEKAAEIYMKIAHLPRVNTITDEQMHLLEKRFGIQAREGYLK